MVKPTSTSSDALRAGDEVITQAIGLFDGPTASILERIKRGRSLEIERRSYFMELAQNIQAVRAKIAQAAADARPDAG